MTAAPPTLVYVYAGSDTPRCTAAAADHAAIFTYRRLLIETFSVSITYFLSVISLGAGRRDARYSDVTGGGMERPIRR